LVPILMKKGRPAHTLSVLCHPGAADGLRDAILVGTSTIGVRQHPVAKYALPRAWVDVDVDGGTVAVKLAHRDGKILQVSPEFDEVADFAGRSARPQHQVLAEVTAAAAAAGLRSGLPVPGKARSTRS